MADEVRVTGGNGSNDRLEVSVKDRAIRVASQQLPLLFVIVVLAGFGYFMATNLTQGQRQGFAEFAKLLDQESAHQMVLLEKLNNNQVTLLQLVNTGRTSMVEELQRQNTMLAEQTVALHKAVDEQTKALRRMLISINWNIGHGPEDRIPLEFTPEEMPQPHRRQER